MALVAARSGWDTPLSCPEPSGLHASHPGATLPGCAAGARTRAHSCAAATTRQTVTNRMRMGNGLGAAGRAAHS
jgi:hypothetical protein